MAREQKSRGIVEVDGLLRLQPRERVLGVVEDDAVPDFVGLRRSDGLGNGGLGDLPGTALPACRVGFGHAADYGLC